MVRSVMEGATYAMLDSLSIVRELGIPVEEIRLSGGGARSAFWRQMQADVYGQEVCTINASQGPAFGAALLAGVGTGMYGSVAEACEATISVVSRTGVQEEQRAVYARAYPMYCKLYESLKADFREIEALVREGAR